MTYPRCLIAKLDQDQDGMGPHSRTTQCALYAYKYSAWP